VPQKFELLLLREIDNPEYNGKVWAVQFAVNGRRGDVFFDLEKNRREMGEDAWMQHLQANALISERGSMSI
jgi:hypothetical protein